MGNRFFTAIRVAALTLLVVWLVACAVAWWLMGSYTVCGIGSRVAGFFSWGVLCGCGLLVLAAPLVTRKDHVRWAGPMRMRRLLPLLGWMAALIYCLFDLPGAGGDGDILATAGFMMFGCLCAGVLALALLGRFLEKMRRTIFPPKN